MEALKRHAMENRYEENFCWLYPDMICDFLELFTGTEKP